MRHHAALIVLAVTACSSPQRGAPPASLPLPSGEIGAEELRRDLYAFAADSMRGRETGTDDAFRAAQFLAARVERLGLEPAGDSLFLQRVPLQRESFATTSRIAVEERGLATELRIGADVVPLVNLAEGVPPTRRDAEGQMIFIGYGVSTKRPARDDLAGLDLEGKVVVVIIGAPQGADSATREALESEGAIGERLAQILPRRPSAVIMLLPDGGHTRYSRLAPELLQSVTRRSARPEIPDADRPLPMILFGVPRAGSPLLPRGWPSDDRPQLLAGRTFVAHVRQERVPFTAYNVVAVSRGSDPALRTTYVALGAHYDHIGVVPPVDGDSIANGADDDGSGTVSLLAIAREMQRAPVRPRRSTLFVWHVGEEKGLLGSAWFTDHPTVPIDSIVAQLNADMIGRNAASVLYTVGPNAAPNGQSKRLHRCRLPCSAHHSFPGRSSSRLTSLVLFVLRGPRTSTFRRPTADSRRRSVASGPRAASRFASRSLATRPPGRIARVWRWN